MASPPPPPPPPPSPGNTSSISAVHPDIIEDHILTRLDPSTLASAACVSTQLNSLTSNHALWTNICHSTWPSTSTPRLLHVISSFPNGPRSFFSDSFTNPDKAATNSSLNLDRPSELISAVDIYYRNEHVFSKVVETETTSGWFDFSTFRFDLLDPKETVPTRIPHPENEDTCRELVEDLKLSWILIDPIGRRAMNLSSYKPVNVQHRSLSSGNVYARYAWVFSAGKKGSHMEYVKCGILVTCEGSENGEMHVRQVSLQLEDMYGKQLSGKDSLVILQEGMVGKRGNVRGREEEGKRRYEEYVEMKRERILKEARTQGRFDIFCVTFWALIFAPLALLFSRR